MQDKEVIYFGISLHILTYPVVLAKADIFTYIHLYIFNKKYISPLFKSYI